MLGGCALNAHSADWIRRVYVVFRRCLDRVAAPRTAEVKDAAIMLEGRLARLRIHSHRADRVSD